MIYREFQGERLSGLGLGMMRLPVLGGDEAAVDEAAAAELVDRACRGGINYFDTAWMYHGGRSEEITGRCLARYPRESYFLADKFPGNEPENLPYVREIFEKQLERCGVDYFDFYLLHNVYEGNIGPYLDPGLGILDYLKEQKRSGRIRHLGFSSHGAPENLREFLEAAGDWMEFCQLQVNYVDWHFQRAEEKVALLEGAGLPVWIMEPVRGGRLARFPEGTEERFRALRPGESAPGWAFRFTQAVPHVGVVLSGISTGEQLEENLRIWATDEPVTEAELAELTALGDADAARPGVPCTGCRYCVGHCPRQLPIPKLLGFYNEHIYTGGGLRAPLGVGCLPEEQRPARCIGCRSCEIFCPQRIEISRALRKLSEMIGL